MPTIDVNLYTFLTDLDGLVPNGEPTGNISWISDDGDPANGCVEGIYVSGDGTPGFVSATDTSKTWETLGVPAGKFVNCVEWLGSNGKRMSPFTTASFANVGFTIQLLKMDNSLITSTGYGVGYATSPYQTWFVADPGPQETTLAGRASNTQLKIVFSFFLDDNIHAHTVQVRADTIQIRITYSDTDTGDCSPPPPPTISVVSDSVTIARATLINAGVPVGGGSSIKARSAGVVAHAVITAAQNACLEVYFAGVDNGDDFTVMAYGAPTELCLLNPVAGHEYILEAPAADLARFLGKRMGNVEFRRAGAGGNYTGDILLRAIELYYKTKTT